MYNFSCLCKLWIWSTTKNNKVKLIFYQPSKDVIVNIVPWAQSPQQFFLWYYPSLIWPRWVYAADLGWWSFHSLELWTECLFGLWKLMKSSLQLHFWYHHFFPQVFSKFLSLKANLRADVCKYRPEVRKIKFLKKPQKIM